MPIASSRSSLTSGRIPDAGKPYRIEMIPTQIFFDAEGKELFRHVGFYGKEDILGKWKELGVDASGSKSAAGIVRETPVAADMRSREAVCFMCDGDVTRKRKRSSRAQRSSASCARRIATSSISPASSARKRRPRKRRSA
jgi:hypothetical protein